MKQVKSGLFYVALGITGIVTGYGCGSSSSDSETSAPAAAEADEELALTEPSPAGVLELAVNAIDQTLSVDGIDATVEAGSLRLAPVEIETTPDFADQDSDGDGKLESSADDASQTPHPDLPACSVNGAPMANATTALSQQDPTFPQAKSDCLISTPDSSDSLAGSISQIKGVLCAFENALGEPIEYLASPGKVYEDVAVTIDTTCFSAAQAENMSEGGSQLTLTLTAILDETKSLPNRIIIGFGENPIILDFMITEDIFSFAKIEAIESSTPDDITIVTMERSAGIVRAIKKSIRGGETVSLLVSGEIDEEGNITEIDKKEVLYSLFAYPNDSTSQFSGTFITAKGDNANGVQYKYADYRCGQYGEAIEAATGPCSDIESGAFTSRATHCDARGSESCLIETPTVNADNLPYFSIYNGFTYTNPAQADLTALLEAPESLCFDELTTDMNPNAACDGSSTAFRLAGTKPKSVNFRRTKQNSGSERRIRDWTANCGEKEGTVALEYAIGGTRAIGNSLISALNSGSGHTVAFNIMTPFGLFYSNYDVTATIYKNGTALGSQQLTTPSPVAKPAMVEIPIELGGFTADDELTLAFSGSFTCAKDATQSGRAGKAYSMSWSPGGPRVLYTP